MTSTVFLFLVLNIIAAFAFALIVTPVFAMVGRIQYALPVTSAFAFASATFWFIYFL